MVDAHHHQRQAARKEGRQRAAHKIAEGTWICGDPGMQYDGAIQKWHTCKGTEPIHSTNPCSEYVFLNNTACNLASLNLMKFKREDGTFDIARFKAAVQHLHHRPGNPGGQRQLSHPGNRGKLPHLPHARPRLRQPRLAHHELRPALDSNEGRALAGAMTAIMTGHAYEQSAEIAAVMGAFKGYHDARCAHVPSRWPTTTSNPCSASSSSTATPWRTSSPARNSII